MSFSCLHMPRSLPALGFALALLFGLSGCAFFKKECKGENCNAPALLDNRPINQYWYCYGTTSQEWQCKNQPDASLIQAVTPERIAPTQQEETQNDR